MKSVLITRKPGSGILIEYSKLFSVLCFWKYASHLSYFRGVYQQRRDCVLKSITRTWKRIEEWDRWAGRKVPRYVVVGALLEAV